MISRIDHVAIAVRDFDRAEHFFRSILGAIPGSQGGDSNLKFFWKIFSLGDLSRVEIITPTGEGSFLDGFLNSRGGGGVHHITMQTPNISATMQFLDQHNIPYFGYKESGENWKELFIHPKDAFGVLIQIAEFRASEWLNTSVNLEKGKIWSINKRDDGFLLEIAHPGGGKVAIELDRVELKQLVIDLHDALDEKD